MIINYAFPNDQSPGMTLRDYFAAAALDAAMIRGLNVPAEKVAEVAYDMADAMIRERNK